MPVPHADIPGMNLPIWARCLWLITVVSLSTLAMLNFIYLVETPHASADSIVTPSADTNLVKQEGSEHGDEVAVICDLIDVSCPGENPVPVQAEVVGATAQKAAAPTARLESQTAPRKKGAPEWMQERINYAWEVSKDFDFILTMERESGFDVNAFHRNKDGTTDHGIPQVNRHWFKYIVDDKRFSDWRWQIEQGWELYQKKVVFYGYYKRNEVRNRFVMN